MTLPYELDTLCTAPYEAVYEHFFNKDQAVLVAALNPQTEPLAL